MNRLKLFCAESIRCPTTSFLLHLLGSGLLENSESLMVLNFAAYVETSSLSSWVRFFIITIRLKDQFGILHSFHPATAGGAQCVVQRALPLQVELISNRGESNLFG